MKNSTLKEIPIPEDNSVVQKYISICHGGAELSEDNGINGLTMGGVNEDPELNAGKTGQSVLKKRLVCI